MIPYADRALVALIASACVFVAGYKVADWRLTSAFEAERHAASEAAREDLRKRTVERDALAVDLAASNDQHQRDMEIARNETNRLRTRLASGGSGLRVAVNCPGPRLGPEAAAGPRVDSGTRAELDPASRRAYFALRDGIDRSTGQLAACQAELRRRVP